MVGLRVSCKHADGVVDLMAMQQLCLLYPNWEYRRSSFSNNDNLINKMYFTL